MILCAGAVMLLHSFYAPAGPWYNPEIAPERVLRGETGGMLSNDRLKYYLEMTGQEPDEEIARAQEEVSGECAAILNVGGEIIEYVTQTRDNDFYLTHNAYGGDDVNGAAFFDECQRRAELFSDIAGLLGKTEIRADHDRVSDLLLADLLLHIICQHMVSGQDVARDLEKALDLPRMQVHQDIAVRPRDLDHIRDQAGGDRNTRLVLFVGTRISHIGDDSGQTGRGVQVKRLEKDQQFHDIAVDRTRSGLDRIAVFTADTCRKFYEKVFIRKFPLFVL